MPDRQERIQYARDLISRNPQTSKRGMQKALVERFGVGLSDTTRRELLREANTPAVLRAKLRSDAFNGYDRVVLKHVLHRCGNAPYVAALINERYARAKAAVKAGEGRRAFMSRMKSESKKAGYLADKTTRDKDHPDGKVKGQIDWWRVLRDVRRKQVEGGDYAPKIRRRPRTERGDIKAQRARYREKQSERGAERRAERERQRLIAQLDRMDNQVRNSSGTRRQELEVQRANLLQMIRSVR